MRTQTIQLQIYTSTVSFSCSICLFQQLFVHILPYFSFSFQSYLTFVLPRPLSFSPTMLGLWELMGAESYQIDYTYLNSETSLKAISISFAKILLIIEFNSQNKRINKTFKNNVNCFENLFGYPYEIFIIRNRNRMLRHFYSQIKTPSINVPIQSFIYRSHNIEPKPLKTAVSRTRLFNPCQKIRQKDVSIKSNSLHKINANSIFSNRLFNKAHRTAITNRQTYLPSSQQTQINNRVKMEELLQHCNKLKNSPKPHKYRPLPSNKRISHSATLYKRTQSFQPKVAAPLSSLTLIVLNDCPIQDYEATSTCSQRTNILCEVSAGHKSTKENCQTQQSAQIQNPYELLSLKKRANRKENKNPNIFKQIRN